MHTATTIGLGLALLGCATDRDGPGSGKDVLPKRGNVESDPTILTATSDCIVGLGTDRFVALEISASDLRGNSNLGTCEITVAGASAMGEFGQNATCYAQVEIFTECVTGTEFIVDVVVANESAGFTTASLRVRP